MGSHIFGFLGVMQVFIFTVSKCTRMFLVLMKVKCSSFNLKIAQLIKIEGD